jgi:outer membrane lipoprotein SlyB
MLRKTILAAALFGSSIVATPVLAKGCIRGAIVGGVAGHYVGRGHALAGAAAGCFIAHHHYAQQAKAQKTAAHLW